MDQQRGSEDAANENRDASHERREEGEESRKEMDEIPPHGTDPLHEGP